MSSLFERQGSRGHRDAVRSDERRRPGRLWVALLLAALAMAIVATTMWCRQQLAAAAGGDPVPTLHLPFHVGAACFLLATGTIVALQSLHVARRVSAPEQRLIQSLRRIRSGDLAFRVHLRRGDLLTDLASECNALIDHLNANPPVGALTGGDVFEVGSVEPEFEGARP